MILCMDELCLIFVPYCYQEAIKSLAFYRAATTKDKAVIDEMSEIKKNQANKQTTMALLPTEGKLENMKIGIKLRLRN